MVQEGRKKFQGGSCLPYPLLSAPMLWRKKLEANSEAILFWEARNGSIFHTAWGRDVEAVKFLRKRFEERSWKRKQTRKRLALYGAGSGSKQYSTAFTSLVLRLVKLSRCFEFDVHFRLLIFCQRINLFFFEQNATSIHDWQEHILLVKFVLLRVLYFTLYLAYFTNEKRKVVSKHL